MARTKTAQSGRHDTPERREPTVNAPVVRFIPISSDDLARDPFRYISDPPRLAGEKKGSSTPDK